MRAQRAAESGLQMAPDGSGFVYYSSGRVAVCVLRGGMVTNFHDDTDRSPILATFTHEGVGSVSFSSGAPRLIVNDKGGALRREAGDIALEWLWVRHGKPEGLPRPLEFPINNALLFRMASRNDATVRLSGTQHVFHVGRRMLRSDTYLDRATGRVTVGEQRGKVVLDLPRPTLVQRQALVKSTRADIAQVQAMHWSLPRVSASGREARDVPLRSALQRAADTALRVQRRVAEGAFTSSITRNTARVSESVSVRTLSPEQHGRALLSRHERWDAKALTHTVPSRVASMPRLPQEVPTVKDSRFAHYLKEECPAQTLLVACCSSRTFTESRAAERMLAALADDWLREQRQPLAATARPTTRVRHTAASQHGRASSSTGGSRSAAAEAQAPASEQALGEHEVEGMPCKLVVVDCSLSSHTLRRFGCMHVPLFVMLYDRDKVVYAETRLSRFAVSKEALVQQIRDSVAAVRQGRFLAVEPIAAPRGHA